MRDGYYLSTYLYINNLFATFDLFLRHDCNVALWKKEGDRVELTHYWELERVTGEKGHKRVFSSITHARRFLNQLLSIYNLTVDDMVEIWGTPGLSPGSNYTSLKDYPDFSYHSIAHLFSALLMDTEKFYQEDFVGLAVDGGPDEVLDPDVFHKNVYTGCVSKKGKLELFHIPSPGPLWFLARYFHRYREGTLMALAGAATSLLPHQLERPEDIFSMQDIIRTSDWYNDIYNQYSTPGQLLSSDSRFSNQDNTISAIMKDIQQMSIEIMDRTVGRIVSGHGLDSHTTNLALAGGYALNCPSNSYLMQKYHFKRMYAPPCVNDGGLALGMGLYAFYKRLPYFSFRLRDAYYGDLDNSLEETAGSELYRPFIKQIESMRMDQAVKDLKAGPVIWFNGRAEIGPRALGNRSILSDPGSTGSKDILNKIKKRQWWRPVAPIVLENSVGDWFENAFPSPFMLHTFTIREDRLSRIQAISHMDRSARIQTVNKEENPLLVQLLERFAEHTGIPMLCNTSLNDAGEPIINRIEEALNFALRKGIRIVYVNGFRITFQDIERFPQQEPFCRRLAAAGKLNSQEKEVLQKELNPHGLSAPYLVAYCRIRELHGQYDLTDARDVGNLRRIVDYLNKTKKISLQTLVNEL